MGHAFRSTVSTRAQITDRDAFEEWYETMRSEDRAYFHYDFDDDGMLKIYAEEGWFLEDPLDEFAAEFAQFLDDWTIWITTVSFQESVFAAGTEIRIDPDGSTEVTHIGSDMGY